MSTSSATSPDSGHSGPRTPSRGQAPSVQFAKSSPVGKVGKYYIPENREQYQRFGYDNCLLLGSFENNSKFLQFLDLQLPPEPVPDVSSRTMQSFVKLANKVAKFIKDRGEHYLFPYLAYLPTYGFHFRFPRAPYPSVR
jgi:hypothetical protein